MPRLLRLAALILAAAALLALAACRQQPAPAPTATPTLGPTPTPFRLPPRAPTPTPEQGSSIVTQIGLIVNQPQAFEGYTLFRPRGADEVYLIDNDGQMVHQWSGARGFAKLLDNGNLLARGQGRVIKEIDRNSNVVWAYRNEVGDSHHDFLKLPNGNLLLTVGKDKTRDEAIAAGGDPDLVQPEGIRYDALLEIEIAPPEGGRIVWEWSLWDHLVQDFDPDKPNYGSPSERPELVDLNALLPHFPDARVPDANDWTHVNGIDYNAQLDQVMLCARNFSELWIIDHSATREEAEGHAGGNSGMGGDLLYRWGNPRRYGSGTDDDQLLFWPHACGWIPNGSPGEGNIIAFSNGDEFQGRRAWHSSIVEITPPVRGHRYEKSPGAAYPPLAPTWFYAADPPEDFWSARLSNAQRLPNGNTLITAGAQGTIFEVTPEGSVVWKYVNPVTPRGRLAQGDPIQLFFQAEYTRWDNSLSRAIRYPLNYPGLEGLDLTPKGTLEQYPDL